MNLLKRFGLAVTLLGTPVASALAQAPTPDASVATAANQVMITGEIKYIRVDTDVTYIQLLTRDQKGNVIEWELERPTIDRRPRLRGQIEPSINVRDWISVLVVPSPTLEPKGQILSASRVQAPTE